MQYKSCLGFLSLHPHHPLLSTHLSQLALSYLPDVTRSRLHQDKFLPTVPVAPWVQLRHIQAHRQTKAQHFERYICMKIICICQADGFSSKVLSGCEDTNFFCQHMWSLVECVLMGMPPHSSHTHTHTHTHTNTCTHTTSHPYSCVLTQTCNKTWGKCSLKTL